MNSGSSSGRVTQLDMMGLLGLPSCESLGIYKMFIG